MLDANKIKKPLAFVRTESRREIPMLFVFALLILFLVSACDPKFSIRIRVKSANSLLTSNVAPIEGADVSFECPESNLRVAKLSPQKTDNNGEVYWFDTAFGISTQCNLIISQKEYISMTVPVSDYCIVKKKFRSEVICTKTETIIEVTLKKEMRNSPDGIGEPRRAEQSPQNSH